MPKFVITAKYVFCIEAENEDAAHERAVDIAYDNGCCDLSDADEVETEEVDDNDERFDN